jgi:aerobic C4-dicarboxylate transport protein
VATAGSLSAQIAIRNRSGSPPHSHRQRLTGDKPVKYLKHLYVQVLIGIAAGVLLGALAPETAAAMRPLGDGFIKLIKMMIAPIIFCTVVHGISSMGDLKRVGRVGLKALIYFETVSTVALAIGLLVGEVLRPGRGFNIDPTSIDAKSVEIYVHQAKEQGIVAHLLGIIPDSFIGALARGDLLQVLLVSILSGFAIAFLGKAGEPISDAIDKAAKMFFGVIRIIVRVAPLTYQLSPHPSPFASQKLYACHVFVERTTATCEAGLRLVTTNGA